MGNWDFTASAACGRGAGRWSPEGLRTATERQLPRRADRSQRREAVPGGSGLKPAVQSLPFSHRVAHAAVAAQDGSVFGAGQQEYGDGASVHRAYGVPHSDTAVCNRRAGKSKDACDVVGMPAQHRWRSGRDALISEVPYGAYLLPIAFVTGCASSVEPGGNAAVATGDGIEFGNRRLFQPPEDPVETGGRQDQARFFILTSPGSAVQSMCQGC